MIVTMKEILERAQVETYAVPAPDVFHGLETRAFLELREFKETMDTNRRSILFLDIANGYKKALRQYLEACGCIGKAWIVEVESISKEAYASVSK